jgi:hypothetical protein
MVVIIALSLNTKSKQTGGVMETDSSPSQQPLPRQPQPGVAPHPLGHRPMIDGFAPRRPITPPGTSVRRPVSDVHASARPRPIAPILTVPGTSTGSTPGRRPTAAVPPPQQPRIFSARAVPSGSTGTTQAASVPQDTDALPATHDTDMPPAGKARPPKERNSTGHAGLVGFAAFVLFGSLLLSPVIPGKISQSFPLSSTSFSTGEQSLDCLGTQRNLNTTTAYTSKAGSPVTYTYSTSTTQRADCNTQSQSAVIGHSSQFNPLGLVLDLVVALAIAIIIARVWRLIFGEKRCKPHKRDT